MWIFPGSASPATPCLALEQENYSGETKSSASRGPLCLEPQSRRADACLPRKMHSYLTTSRRLWRKGKIKEQHFSSLLSQSGLRVSLLIFSLNNPARPTPIYFFLKPSGLWTSGKLHLTNSQKSATSQRGGFNTVGPVLPVSTSGCKALFWLKEK